MKKSLLYTALWLMGLMGALAIWVVNAATITHYTWSNIEYRLNNDTQHFTWVWTITITDWKDTITILDRNLWATKAGTWCEDLDREWKCRWWDETYWYHFQWGNNRWFAPCTWDNYYEDTMGHDVCDAFPWWEDIIYFNPKDNPLVPASLVGPGYSSWSFIALTSNWINDNNKVDMWWWSMDEVNIEDYIVVGEEWYDIKVKDDLRKIDKANDRQWPCPEWFHVPSASELIKLIEMMWWILSGDEMHDKLYIPFAGRRSNLIGETYNLGEYFILRSSSPAFGEDLHSKTSSLAFLFPDEDGFSMPIVYSNLYSRTNGNSIRCFYNKYETFHQPLTISFMDGSEEVWTWKAVADSIYTWNLPDITKEWYTFDYRYLSGANPVEEFKFETTPISWDWADDDGKVYFIAQWTGIKYSVEFTWTDIEWTMPNQEFTYGIAQNLTANAFTKNWYTFSWWTDGTNIYTNRQSVKNLTTISGNIIILTAQRTKDKQTGGYSGGGWMKKDNCPNGDLSPSYYDGTCEGDNTQDSSADKSASEWQTWSQEILSPSDSSFTKEQKDAYTFAFKNGITTMNTIDKAKMDRYIKRGHLAKMVVNYVTNVLWREIQSDIPASCLSFNDEATVRESEEIKDYAIKSCTLWLMWIRMKNNEFLPNDYVTRAEFGAVISRVLWWDKYNLVHTKEKPRYTDHLNALKDEWIMTKIDNPKMLEKRWYVMIMLMRSTKWK